MSVKLYCVIINSPDPHARTVLARNEVEAVEKILVETGHAEFGDLATMEWESLGRGSGAYLWSGCEQSGYVIYRRDYLRT
jgi:hypothetical protein